MALTVSELIDRRLAWGRLEYVKHGRPTSSAHRERAALEHFRSTPAPGSDEREPDEPSWPPGATLGTMYAEDLARDDLSRFMRRLGNLTKPAKSSGGGKPYTLATVNSYRDVVVRMARWAEDEGLVPEGLAARLAKTPKLKPGKTKARRKRKVAAASEEVILGVAAFCRRHADDHPRKSRRDRQRRRRWYLLAIALELMWRTGSRPGELVQLRLCDLTEDPELRGCWIYTPKEWKTEHEDAAGGDAARRMIYLDAGSRALVDEAVGLYTHEGGQATFDFAVELDPRTRLFPWRSADPNHARSAFGRALKGALEKAGLPTATLHQIRHAWITRAAAISVEGARVGAGHTELSTTSRYLDNNGPAVRGLFRQLNAESRPPQPEPTPTPTPPTPPAPPTAARPNDEPPRLRLVGT
jgi:integrase